MTATYTPQARAAYHPSPEGLNAQQAYELITAEASEYAQNTTLHEELGLGQSSLTEGMVNGPHTWLYLDETDNQVQNFKLNGAGNAVDKVAGVLTPGSDLLVPSAGNWAQAVIHAAGFFGFNAVVYCPRDITAPKEEAIHQRAAEAGTTVKVMKNFNSVDSAISRATNDAAGRDDAELLHPFDNVYGVAGQALIGKRIVAGLVQRADQKLWHPYKDQVVIEVPQGGGSLLAATAFEVEKARLQGRFGSNVEVRAARPNQAADIKKFDGLDVKRMGTLGRLANNDQRFVRGTTTFSEADAGRALGLIYQAIRKKVEPSGAAATAAMLADAANNKQPTTYVSVISGANVSDERYAYFRDAPRREQAALLRSGGPLGTSNERYTKQLMNKVNGWTYGEPRRTLHSASGPTWEDRDPS